jgi:hypothetical protein
MKWLASLLLFWTLMADPVFVSAVGNATGGSGTTRTTPSKATTTGNFLFVAVTHYTASVNISSISDTAGNGYAKAGTTQGGDSNQDNEIWYTANPITGHATNVVSILFSGTPSFVDLAFAEFSWSGVSSISYDAESTHALPNTTSLVSNTVTTTAADDLILGNWVAFDSAEPLSNSTGTKMWEQGSGTATDDMVFAYRNTDAAGGYTIALTEPSNGLYRYSIVAKAFKGNASAGAGAAISIIAPILALQHIQGSLR